MASGEERIEPAPVARYEGIGSGDQVDAPVARFDGFTDRTAASVAGSGDAPVAGSGDAPVAGLGDGPVGPDAPVADLADLAAGRPELRVARLSELSWPGRGRRRSSEAPERSAPTPGTSTAPRSTAPRARRRRAPEDAPPGPGFGPGPEEELTEPSAPAEPAAPDARPARGGRRGWGAPAELPPGVDPVAAAKDICLRLLTDRARTRQELAQALRRKGVPDEAAGSVLERFDEVGLIDDAAFAGQWVRSRHNHKGLARRAIAMELRRKGVDDEVAGEALTEVDAESEEKRAEELVARKLRSLTVTTPEQRASATRRLVGMLARKGYGPGTAYRVVKDALAAHGVDVEELGTAEPGD